MALKKYIAEVINRRDLSHADAEMAMNVIMGGEATAAQIGSYLTALRMKGETVAEVAGSAAAMRAHVVRVSAELEPNEILADTCGTGGDGAHTFNISTTAAFVVAGAGVKVAKHGNRAVSSKSGSADVLLALGGNLDLNAAQVGQCIDAVGSGFLYAIKHHPAMRHAIGPRRELGQRTIFNILGPLTNPAGATHQLIGVFDPALTEVMAGTLAELGTKAAFVVHGHDGLDELTTTGLNRVSHLLNGEVRTFTFDPATLGLARAVASDLMGGDSAENAAITQAVLSGEDQGAKRDIVLLNAAAVLAAGSGDLTAGLEKARVAIDSGAAYQKLTDWVAYTNRF